MADIIALKYVGLAGAFRPSIPARDLDAAELLATAGGQKRLVADLVAEALGSEGKTRLRFESRGDLLIGHVLLLSRG